MKARPTIPMAAPCTTTEATKEDGPLRGSGWIENRVIVREDLIRRVDPSQIELPAPTLHAKQVFEQCECCWVRPLNCRSVELCHGELVSGRQAQRSRSGFYL